MRGRVADMNLQIVPHTHLDQVWPVVGQMLARVCDEKASAGECTIDQIRMSIVQRERHLVVAMDGDEIIGAGTIEFLNYPNKRVALIGALGGSGIVSPESFRQVSEWCKGMGASELRAYAKEAQARLFGRVGMEKIYEVMGVSL